MKYSIGLVACLIFLVVTVTSSLGADNLSHKLERKGIVVGTTIKLDARTAPELVGTKGIVVGTCRQLPGKALILQGKDNRSYQLPDGVYENGQGLRLHIRRGGIERISVSPKMAR